MLVFAQNAPHKLISPLKVQWTLSGALWNMSTVPNKECWFSYQFFIRRIHLASFCFSYFVHDCRFRIVSKLNKVKKRNVSFNSTFSKLRHIQLKYLWPVNYLGVAQRAHPLKTHYKQIIFIFLTERTSLSFEPTIKPCKQTTNLKI